VRVIVSRYRRDAPVENEIRDHDNHDFLTRHAGDIRIASEANMAGEGIEKLRIRLSQKKRISCRDARVPRKNGKVQERRNCRLDFVLDLSLARLRVISRFTNKKANFLASFCMYVEGV